MIAVNDFWRIMPEPEIASFSLQKLVPGAAWVTKGFHSTREGLQDAVTRRCGYCSPAAAAAIEALPAVAPMEVVT